MKLLYSDSARMVTVGGVLPAKGVVSTIKSLVNRKGWPCISDKVISAPPLTIREAAVLQAELPRVRKLTRRRLQALGFDLEEDQLRIYEKYYQYYPSYAQIST